MTSDSTKKTPEGKRMYLCQDGVAAWSTREYAELATLSDFKNLSEGRFLTDSELEARDRAIATDAFYAARAELDEESGALIFRDDLDWFFKKPSNYLESKQKEQEKK